MVKFGQFLKHNIVPEWREKYIDYKGLKKIISGYPEEEEDVELGLEPIVAVTLSSMKRTKDAFREVDSSSVIGMVDLKGQVVNQDSQEYSRTFCATAHDKITESLLVRTNRTYSEWEGAKGTLNYQWVLPVNTSTKEQKFFQKLYQDIEMVNEMYVLTIEESISKYNGYCKQVERFCDLRNQNMEIPKTSQKFRRLQFGLKELYRMIECLHNYCSLNRTAIDKILKKHDKRSSCESRATVMKAISELSFYKETSVPDMRNRTEFLWRQFIGKDRIITMRDLKGTGKSTTSIQSFLIGLCVGASIILICILFIIIFQYPIIVLSTNEINSFWILWRFQLMYCIQLWMWSLDLYVYHNNRINFEFIFEKYSPSLLHYQQQFLLASLYTVLLLSCVVIWYYCSFVAFILPKSYYWIITPMLLLLFCFFSLPLPGIFYKARKYMFIHTIRIFRTPFYEVHFPDFFIGDQMTSHNQTLTDLLHLLINLFSASFVTYSDYYLQLSSVSREFLQFVPTILPTLIRLLQCLRRYYDTHDEYPHMFNCLKYFLSTVSMCFFWHIPTHIVIQFVYTLYALNWDLREDWGLFRNFKKGKYFLLRDQKVRTPCLLSNPWKYYWAISNNVLLRLMWIVKIAMRSMISREWSQLVFGCVEVFRRGWWNIFRMENEQVSNCGKFRATLDVPVPFPELLCVC